MDIIKLKGTDDTPSIILDKDAGIFEFSGKSMPEDVATFYGPIIEWIENYGKEALSKTSVIFKLEYFNTASSKMILDVLMKFEEIHQDGHEVKISWYFMEDDEDMKEAGEEYADIVDIPFEYVPY
ncbi:MAG: DUF1987 domain-containing protein [Bacteroidota bacterium]